MYYSYGDAQKMRHMLKQSAEENGTSKEQMQHNSDSLNSMVGSIFIPLHAALSHACVCIMSCCCTAPCIECSNLCTSRCAPGCMLYTHAFIVSYQPANSVLTRTLHYVATSHKTLMHKLCCFWQLHCAQDLVVQH